LIAKALLATFGALALASAAQADQLRLNDGSVVTVDEAWEDAQGVWYRQAGVTHLLERARVKKIERSPREQPASTVSEAGEAGAKPVARVGQTESEAQTVTSLQTVWIHLVGGARVEADEATETAAGVWYRRGTLSIFVDKARVEHVEREPLSATATTTVARVRRERGWTTGNAKIDGLIKQNGSRHVVDPYLIFCVMEQESHFNARVVSPVGARGLMQLMPGTAARFGVRHSFDPAENISGGTRYLKELLRRFNGRVDLVLAGYNAGEGAVIKYGLRVPPYRETRNYVRRISARYGRE